MRGGGVWWTPTIRLTHSSLYTHLKMAAVLHLGAEWREVAAGAKLGQSMTFDPYGCLGEVEVGGICELDDIGAVEVGKPHG